MGIESYTGGAKSAIGAAYGLYEDCQFLSDPKAYMLILPFIFLCFDEKRGAKLTLAVLFAGACNDTLKIR